METTADQTILDALARHSASRPNRIACRAGDRTLTFAELDKATCQIANAMQAS